MKKSGFTLAELLISLGITGVIAALMTTALVTLQPDQKKAIYLRNYDALTKAVKALAGNSKLFPVCQDNLNCQAHPLFNTATGIEGRFASIGAGDGKLCKGLSYMMNGQMLPQLNCESQPITYSDGNWTPSFRTYRTEWLVSTLRELNGSSATYQSDVYFDLNGPEGPNCIYSDSCQNPDRFKFLVAADGTVIPADPVGQEYISKRKNWRKSKLSIAEDSTTKENLLASLRTFSLTPCHEESSGENDDGVSKGVKNYTTSIPCGANLYGKIINCYSIQHYYENNKLTYLSDFSKYLYPTLFDPRIINFSYPVASKLSLERFYDGAEFYLDNHGNKRDVFPTCFGNTHKEIVEKATVNINETTGIENKFYYYQIPNSSIKYPTSFNEILINLQDYVACQSDPLYIFQTQSYITNKESLTIDINTSLNKHLGLAGAIYRCVPIEDDRYIYLMANWEGQAEDVMEIYYAIHGELKVFGDEYIKLISNIWNLDAIDTNKRRQQIKNDLSEGYDVFVYNRVGNSSYGINAKELNLK